MLRATSVAPAIAFLAERPIENAYLLSLLAGEARTLIADQTCVLHRDASGAIDGIVNFSQNVVPAASETAARAFARYALTLARPRMIVGPRRTIAAYWETLAPRYPPPRMVRAIQPLLVADRQTLRGSGGDANVRTALPDEADLIAEHSATMIAGELGYDPRETRMTFAAGVAYAVERGWWWVLIENGELQFMCNVGIATAYTAQLQGVWTPPALRRRGLAQRALGAIGARLLERFPTLSLYVNDFNRPALALYRRLGFEQAGEFSTVLL